MTKADLVDFVTDATGLAKRDVAVVVDRFIDAVGNALAAGQHIEIRGFGSFKVKSRRARIARNPRSASDAARSAHSRRTDAVSGRRKDRSRSPRTSHR